MSDRDAPSREHQFSSTVTDDGVRHERFVLWPHRSLDRKGVTIILMIAAFGLALAIARVWQPGAWFIIVPAAITFLGLAFAFWVSARRARLAEIIDVSPEEITVSRSQRGHVRLVARFNPHWVRLLMRSDRYVKNRIILSESGRAVSVGEFLSPPERKDLADALLTCLEQAKSCGGHSGYSYS